MPFPLAHPAAVLPLKRCCPRRLSFPALVIGSISPDLGYCFGISNFSHSFFPGSFAFCLPVGLLVLGVFYGIRLPAVEMLPGRLKQAFLPLCQRAVDPPFRIVISLLIGTWTHLFLDSIAHQDGWTAERLPFLQASMQLRWGISLTGCQVFYTLFTFFGVAWLAISYWRWLENATGFPKLTKPWVMGSCTFVLAILVLCAATAARGRHRLLNGLALGIISTFLVSLFLSGTGMRIMLAPGGGNEQRSI